MNIPPLSIFLFLEKKSDKKKYSYIKDLAQSPTKDRQKTDKIFFYKVSCSKGFSPSTTRPTTLYKTDKFSIFRKKSGINIDAARV